MFPIIKKIIPLVILPSALSFWVCPPYIVFQLTLFLILSWRSIHSSVSCPHCPCYSQYLPPDESPRLIEGLRKSISVFLLISLGGEALAHVPYTRASGIWGALACGAMLWAMSSELSSCRSSIVSVEEVMNYCGPFEGRVGHWATQSHQPTWP